MTAVLEIGAHDGAHFAVLGNGWSLRDATVDADIVIGVNRAPDTIPSDIWLTQDAEPWAHGREQYKGSAWAVLRRIAEAGKRTPYPMPSSPTLLLFATAKFDPDKPGDDLTKLWGENTSVITAINLAILLGASGVSLYGVDLCGARPDGLPVHCYDAEPPTPAMLDDETNLQPRMLRTLNRFHSAWKDRLELVNESPLSAERLWI